MAASLTAFLALLDGLGGRAAVADLTAYLDALDLTVADVAEFIRFSDAGYRRNQVHGGPFHEVRLLCWKSGQSSPIHDHAQSSCAVRVVAGTATVHRFERRADGRIVPAGSAEHPSGATFASADDDLHRVANEQAEDLITLHVYSPPLDRAGEYAPPGAQRRAAPRDRRPVITAAPENSETPLAAVQSWVTPRRLFFVRNHFEPPGVDLDAWRLRIHGLVGRERLWRWEDLLALPSRSVFTTMECAGNGRSFLQPPQHGVQWTTGAVGNAEWTGAPLVDVLRHAGLDPAAVEVVAAGADSGTEPGQPERMHFARSLPLAKALHPDTLLAYRMNGEWLTPSHGFPVRLLVPGWYGVASVKWLQALEVVAQPYRGYFQSVKYTYQRRSPAALDAVAVGPMVVKSEILEPRPDAALHLGAHRISGLAWAGEDAVARVEVSTDGGRTWNEADLMQTAQRYCWVMWEYLWEASQPGRHEILCRAVSRAGRTQPREHDPLHGGYLIHHSRPRTVAVGGDPRGRSALGSCRSAGARTARWDRGAVEIDVGAGI